MNDLAEKGMPYFTKVFGFKAFLESIVNIK